MATKRTPADFEFGDELGTGAYGSVCRAEERATGEQFAVKVIEKRHIVKEDKRKYVFIERDMMNRCKHPGIVRLRYTFQDASSLYFVQELAAHGELLHKIQELGSLNVESTRFVAAEIVAVLEYLFWGLDQCC